MLSGMLGRSGTVSVAILRTRESLRISRRACISIKRRGSNDAVINSWYMVSEYTPDKWMRHAVAASWHAFICVSVAA